MLELIGMFFQLVMGHYLADFALQSDWMAKFKAPKSFPYWLHVMTAHCAIQALSVWLITHSWVFTAMEFFGHFAIDVLKCKGKIGFGTDQALHISMKLLYVSLDTILVFILVHIGGL